MDIPIFYGQRTNRKEFCGNECIVFNERRKEVGLKPLKDKALCE
jgi:hypothetical protein